MISAYSFVMSVILFNVSLIIVYMLRRRKDFIAMYGVQTLLAITVLGLLRLFVPVDLEIARIIRSYELVPAIQSGLEYQPIGLGISIGAVLLGAWVIGAVVFILREAVLAINVDMLRRNYIVTESAVISKVANELGMGDDVVITSCVPMPHVAGVFRQKIYVPPLELSESDWKYILIHEKQHIKAHDQLIKLMFHILRAVFWWNPVSHLFVKELDAMLELRCDSAVTSDLNDAVSLEYFTAMVHAIKEMSTDGKAASGKHMAVGIISESKADIRERYEVYLNINKRKSRTVRNAIQVAIFLLFILSYSFIVQPAYMPPEEDLIGTGEVTDNVSSLIMNDGDSYWLIIDDEIIMELSEENLSEFPYNTFPIYGGGD